jgi:hypothetical protein
MRTRYFNYPHRRLPFVSPIGFADEGDAQIETWMLGSGNEPTSNSLRFDNASVRSVFVT